MFTVLVALVVSSVLLVWFMRAALRVVPEHQAFVVLDRFTGAVLSTAIGPKLTFLVPLIEKARPLDLALRSVSMSAGSVATRGCERVFVPVFEVLFAFDRQLLTPARLNEMLPVLDDIERVVRSAANYALRAVLAESYAASIEAPGTRSRLEKRVREILGADLARMAISVLGVHLLVEPDPRVVEAAASARIRAQELAFLATLDSRTDTRRLLELQMLDRARKGDGHLVTAFTLPLGVPGTRERDSDVSLQWFADTSPDYGSVPR